MLYYDSIDLSQGFDVAKSNKKKNAQFVTIVFLIMDLNFKILFAMIVMI